MPNKDELYEEAKALVWDMMPTESFSGCDVDSSAFRDLYREHGLAPENYEVTVLAVGRYLQDIADRGGFGDFSKRPRKCWRP